MQRFQFIRLCAQKCYYYTIEHLCLAFWGTSIMIRPSHMFGSSGQGYLPPTPSEHLSASLFMMIIILLSVRVYILSFVISICISKMMTVKCAEVLFYFQSWEMYEEWTSICLSQFKNSQWFFFLSWGLNPEPCIYKARHMLYCWATTQPMVMLKSIKQKKLLYKAKFTSSLLFSPLIFKRHFVSSVLSWSPSPILTCGISSSIIKLYTNGQDEFCLPLILEKLPLGSPKPHSYQGGLHWRLWPCSIVSGVTS